MAIDRSRRRRFQARQRTPSPPSPPSPTPTPTPPLHSPAPTPPPSPLYDPMWPIRNEINELFFEHGFSFEDPNDIVDKVTKMWFDCQDPLTGDFDDMALQATSHGRILQILEAIGQDEAQHRHHKDAENIVAEYLKRVAGEPAKRLVPDPRSVIYYGFRTPPRGSKRYIKLFGKKGGKKPGDPGSDEDTNSKQFLYPPQLDKYAPLPRVRFYPEFQGFDRVLDITAPVKENDIALRWLRKFAQNEGATNAILNMLRTGGYDRGLDPALLMLDDPLEMVLRLPEKMPLLDGATPFTDPGKQNRANWPLVEVYDSRRGSRLKQKRLLQDNYITKFVAIVRQMVTLPEVAKKYAIIFRAHPSRYQEGTPEELIDEEAPTAAEVECIIDFFSMAFPVIEIFRTLPELNGKGTHAEISREEEPNLILINGNHFDAIEEGLRNGVNIGHYFFFLMVTITHELGHYLYGCIYFGQNIGSRGQRVKPWIGNNKDDWPNWPPESVPGGERYILETPRRLRVNITSASSRYRSVVGYSPLFYREGEMGEIIEWLIYGFLSYISLNGNPYDYFTVVCWGSNIYQKKKQIRFDGDVGTKLYMARPPVRMNAVELRKFIAEVKKESIYEQAEKAARRVYATEIVRVPKEVANALADAERVRCYSDAGKPVPELFRLKPKDIILKETVLREGRIPIADGEMVDIDAGEEQDQVGASSGNNMEIELPSDADEHYIARTIPKGSKYKRYHQCIHRVNAEKLGALKKFGPTRTLHNNPDQVAEPEPSIPSSIFSPKAWESLRLILALSLPMGVLWIFKSDLYWIEKEEASLKWDIILTAYVCCLSLPSHISSRFFPWIGQVFVRYGDRFSLLLAFLLYLGCPMKKLRFSPGDGLLSRTYFWIFLFFGLWKFLFNVLLALRRGITKVHRKWA